MQFIRLVLCFGVWLFGARQLPAQGPAILQPRNGLPGFFEKLKGGKPVSVVYLGGSITQAPGYRLKSTAALQKWFPSSAIQSYNAGVGGTGSDLGLFRVPQELSMHKPDLVFVEFAVNDYGSDAARVARSVEGIVRQIKSAGHDIDICFLYTISRAMLEDYRAGRLPASVRVMEQVAAWYGIPSVNFAPDVLALQGLGKLVFQGSPGRQDKDQLLFTTDGTHPLDAGHELYTKTLQQALLQLSSFHSRRGELPAMKFGALAEPVNRYRPDQFQLSGGWIKVAPSDSLGAYLDAFPGLCYAQHGMDSLVVEFEGTAFGMEDVIGPATNGFSIQVDGNPAFKIVRFDKYCSRYRRHYFLLDPLSQGRHRIVVRPDFSPLDKAVLLKPEDKSRYEEATYGRHRMYAGSILLAGKVFQH